GVIGGRESSSTHMGGSLGREGSRGSARPSTGDHCPCCCNVKMSSPNCHVKESSSHGDLHGEPKGTASSGVAQGGLRGPGDERAGGRRPRDERPPRATTEAAL